MMKLQNLIDNVQSEPMLAAVGAVIALATVWVTWFGVKAQERARQQHYLTELRKWAGACTHDLSSALHLCLLEPRNTIDPSFFNRRHALLIRLSAKIDEGRWFFPNLDTPGVGDWKDEAFRGSRQRPLTALVYCYNTVKEMSYGVEHDNKKYWDFLSETKRSFTNDIQKMLDPRKSYREFRLDMIHDELDARSK